MQIVSTNMRIKYLLEYKMLMGIRLSKFFMRLLECLNIFFKNSNLCLTLSISNLCMITAVTHATQRQQTSAYDRAHILFQPRVEFCMQ